MASKPPYPRRRLKNIFTHSSKTTEHDYWTPQHLNSHIPNASICPNNCTMHHAATTFSEGMMPILKKTLLSVAIITTLAGCAASGTQIKQDQLTQLQKGKTTYSQVISEFGEPQNQTMMSDGSRVVIYSYAQVQTRPETFIPFVGAFVGGADTKTNSVTFTFNSDGTLKDYSSSTGTMGTGMGLASGTGPSGRVEDQPKQAP